MGRLGSCRRFWNLERTPQICLLPSTLSPPSTPTTPCKLEGISDLPSRRDLSPSILNSSSPPKPLNSQWIEWRRRLMRWRSAVTRDIISTTERLKQEMEVTTQRQEIVSCFLRDYQLSNEEINALREEDLNENFFQGSFSCSRNSFQLQDIAQDTSSGSLRACACVDVNRSL